MLIRKLIENQRKHQSTDLVEFLVHQNIRKDGQDLSPNGDLSQKSNDNKYRNRKLGFGVVTVQGVSY